MKSSFILISKNLEPCVNCLPKTHCCYWKTINTSVPLKKEQYIWNYFNSTPKPCLLCPMIHESSSWVFFITRLPFIQRCNKSCTYASNWHESKFFTGSLENQKKTWAKKVWAIEADEKLSPSIPENGLRYSRTSKYHRNIFDLVENVQSAFMHILIFTHLWNGVWTKPMIHIQYMSMHMDEIFESVSYLSIEPLNVLL